MAKRKLSPEYLQATNGQWYFRIEAANGESLASPEQYKTMQGAKKGFNALRNWFKKYEEQNMTEETNEETIIDGWLFWEQNEDGSLRPLALTDDEKWVAEQRAALNTELFPASTSGRAAIMEGDRINDFVGHRPPTRPK